MDPTYRYVFAETRRPDLREERDQNLIDRIISRLFFFFLPRSKRDKKAYRWSHVRELGNAKLCATTIGTQVREASKVLLESLLRPETVARSCVCFPEVDDELLEGEIRRGGNGSENEGTQKEEESQQHSPHGGNSLTVLCKTGHTQKICKRRRAPALRTHAASTARGENADAQNCVGCKF